MGCNVKIKAGLYQDKQSMCDHHYRTVLFNTPGNGSFSSTIICNDFHYVSLIKMSFTTELFHLLFIFKYTQYVLVNKKRPFKDVFVGIVFSTSKSVPLH